MMVGSPLLKYAQLAFLLCTLAGCVHVTHSARVKAGWSGEVVVARAHEGYGSRGDASSSPVPASGEAVDVQINIGHGWRFSPNSALLAELLIPLSAHDASALGAMCATSLDLYYQFLAWPLDTGAGAVLGAIPSIYLETGKTLTLSDDREVSLGVGVMAGGLGKAHFPTSPSRSWKGFLSLSLSGSHWMAAIWGDYDRYPGVWGRCDDDCDPDDFIKNRSAAGFMLGRRLR